jgi:hypothetical protein
MAALFFYFAKFTSHIMRETTAVKSEDPEEGTIREKIITKVMDEARFKKMNSIERLTMSQREVSASCFSYCFFF